MKLFIQRHNNLITGGALFVIGCAGGFALFTKPASLLPLETLRDAVFYLIACLWIVLAFRDGHISYTDVFGMNFLLCISGF